MQPGFPDLGQLMMQAQQMQQDMQRAQESLAHAVVSGTAGGGLVTAVMAGDGQLQAVQIDPSVVDPEDVETLGDLIVAAVRDAQREVAQLSSSTMGAVTEELTGALSGFGFGGAVIDSDDDDSDEDDDDSDEDDPDDPLDARRIEG